MILKRTAAVGLRIPLNELDDIEKHVKSPMNPDGKYHSVSEAIRECTKLGSQILSYQEMMKDPEKKNEFVQKMQELLKNQDFEKMSQTLTVQQIDGFQVYLQIEKDKRFKQGKLR